MPRILRRAQSIGQEEIVTVSGVVLENATVVMRDGLVLDVGTAAVIPKDARVLDGTGNPAFFADVALRDGRVAAIGRLRGATAARVIDAKGKYVGPGFIDMQSHAEGGLASQDAIRRAAP